MTLTEMKRAVVLLAAAELLLLTAAASFSFAEDWETALQSKLPVFGHRNWIVIADAAYPKQSAPGIETIYTGAASWKCWKKF